MLLAFIELSQNILVGLLFYFLNILFLFLFLFYSQVTGCHILDRVFDNVSKIKIKNENGDYRSRNILWNNSDCE